MASKIGPDLESHPKIRHAWAMHHSSLGLHLLGLSFAQRTGGFVSTAFVNEKVPAKRERTAALEALMTVAPGEENPMWSAADGGWRIHNFDKHAEFRSDEEAEKLSRARSEAGRKGAAAKWQTDGNLPEACHDGAIDLPGISQFGQRKVVPTTTHREELFSLSKMLADGILANDPKAKVAPESQRWLDAARLLIDMDKRPVAEVERVIQWCQADGFWRSNILSMPKLRAKYSQLLLRMTAPRPTNIRSGAGQRMAELEAMKGTA